MNLSVIVSVYKNTENLKIILDALQNQSIKGFEVIVSEDGDSSEMSNFISAYLINTKQKLKHVTQADNGWRKNKALNNAIINSSGDYLIFIDGDCVPHYKFVEEHVKNAEKDKILVGTRIMLSNKYSNVLKNEGMLIFCRRYLFRILLMSFDGTKFVGKGIYLSPNNPIKFILRKNKKSKGLVGCNMSFHKEAIMAINGFDEDYVAPAVGEDDDLVWRFDGLGYSFKSVKNMAIVYHLHHKKIWSNSDKNRLIMKEKKSYNQFFCLNGISKKNYICKQFNMRFTAREELEY